MKVGIYLDLRNPPTWRQDWSRLYGFGLELCEEAERLGAGSVWLSEHHLFDDGYLTRPLTYAAAVAARTTRVRIGTAVVIAPLHRAVDIAEEAAVVDLISGGRLELGVGAGYRLPEFELFGADFEHRYGATDQFVRDVRATWSDPHHVPGPVQARVPIWMGYTGPAGARRCGRLGERLLAPNRDSMAPYLEGLREGQHDLASARMGGLLSGFVSDDPERDWPMVAKHLSHQWDTYRRYMVEGTGGPAPKPIDPDAWRARGIGGRPTDFLYAEPARAAALIREHFAGMPIDTLFLWASPAALPEADAMRHVANICELGRSLADDSAPA